MRVHRLRSFDEQALAQLAEVLIDCVAGGASVSFMLPISLPQAGEYWRGVAQSAARGERVLDTASAEAARLYERHGWQRVGLVPGYALYPDGRPCATTFYFKSLQ